MSLAMPHVLQPPLWQTIRRHYARQLALQPTRAVRDTPKVARMERRRLQEAEHVIIHRRSRQLCEVRLARLRRASEERAVARSSLPMPPMRLDGDAPNLSAAPYPETAIWSNSQWARERCLVLSNGAAGCHPPDTVTLASPPGKPDGAVRSAGDPCMADRVCARVGGGE